jgi:hypothetical protein
MKKYFYKYIVEFFVIVTGVLISFYVEKNKAAEYRDELKNHSLNRLTINIQEDISDSKINYRIHSSASNACGKLINDYDRLYNSRKDSIGLLLRIASKSWSIFIDNPEEYLTLRNSGLIELVDHDSLIILLQKKYSYHQLYKQYESHIYANNAELIKVFNDKTDGRKLVDDEIGSRSYSGYGELRDNQDLTSSDFNLIRRRLELSKAYSRSILDGIKRDSLIVVQLNRLITDD